MPWEARRLQPSEVWGLARGDQDQWNRTCQLAGWATWMIVMAIPSFAKSDWRKDVRGLGAFLKKFPPPGYRPEPEKPDKKRKR